MAIQPVADEGVDAARAAIDAALEAINADIDRAAEVHAATEPGPFRKKLNQKLDMLLEQRDAILQARSMLAPSPRIAAAIRALDEITARNVEIADNMIDGTSWLVRLDGWINQSIAIAKQVNKITKA